MTRSAKLRLSRSRAIAKDFLFNRITSDYYLEFGISFPISNFRLYAIQISRIDLVPYRVPTQVPGSAEECAAAEKGVKAGFTFIGVQSDQCFWKRDREHSRMGVPVMLILGFRDHLPDIIAPMGSGIVQVDL